MADDTRSDGDAGVEGPAGVASPADADDARDGRLQEVREAELRLRGAVDAGEMTPEEAEAEMAEHRVRVRAEDRGSASTAVIDRRAADLPELPDDLARAVEVGALLAEERARLHARIEADELTEDEAGRLYEQTLEKLVGELVDGGG